MRGKREEGRGKREEGRGKREEGRGKREEGTYMSPSSFAHGWAKPWSENMRVI
jgi:hypothetical protein